MSSWKKRMGVIVMALLLALLAGMVTPVLAEVYLPMVMNGSGGDEVVVGPVTGRYRLMEDGEWFQVFCPAGAVTVVVSHGMAMMHCGP